jgi:hypothetical protein
MTTITKPLVDRLLGDATLTGLAPGGVWLDIAPPVADAPRPVVVVSLQQAPLDGETMACITVVRRFRYAVSVEGTQTQAADVRSAAQRIDTLLHRVNGWTATGWTVGRSAFVDVTERATTDGGDTRLLTITGLLEVVAERD